MKFSGSAFQALTSVFQFRLLAGALTQSYLVPKIKKKSYFKAYRFYFVGQTSYTGFIYKEQTLGFITEASGKSGELLFCWPVIYRVPEQSC